MHVIQCSVNLYMRWLAAAAADTGSAAECRFLPNQDGDVARIRRYQWHAGFTSFCSSVNDHTAAIYHK